MRIWRIAAIGAALVVCATSASWGFIQYSGNRLIFCFFSFVIFAIAYFAIRHPTQYAHFFLGLAWFLGFWVKYLLHQATGATYYEPHGSFDGSPGSWDAVLLVVGIGGAGYLVGRFLRIPGRKSGQGPFAQARYCCSILVGVVPQRNLVACRIARLLRARDQSGIRTPGPGACGKGRSALASWRALCLDHRHWPRTPALASTGLGPSVGFWGFPQDSSRCVSRAR